MIPNHLQQSYEQNIMVELLNFRLIHVTIQQAVRRPFKFQQIKKYDR
jgi:hypothetical protein